MKVIEEQRLGAFVRLGNKLNNLHDWSAEPADEFEVELREKVKWAQAKNGWFTPQNTWQALRAIGHMLRPESLEKWISAYEKIGEPGTSRKVGIIMAGNIPLVGFHDFLAVLVSGHQVQAKLASSDDVLLPYLADLLIADSPELSQSINFIERLSEPDAVIATGNNNSARYFEYYFGKYPHIIRRNRNSVAVLNGTETDAELHALGEDIFTYFGLGCRNVSKIFIPQDYDLDIFFRGIFPFQDVINHNKYANNYDYHKAIWLMNRDEIIENGFLILKEDTSIASPAGTLFYERYNDEVTLQQRLRELAPDIQCVVSQKTSPLAKPSNPNCGIMRMG